MGETLDDPLISVEGSDGEKVEGFDRDEDDSLGQYPIDSLLIRQESRTIYEVVRRIDKGLFLMDPDFQRDFIWPEKKQSKLIESCLMRIPLPVFYLAEQENGKTVVVDGLQRLSTFKRFLSDKLVLSGLVNDLNGKRFSQLSPKLQNRIEDTNLIIYLIDHAVPSKAKLDIFDRVNSGMQLTKQQMRNALFNGPATRFLADAAKSEQFLQATGGSFNDKQMRDREAINRFCAFSFSSHIGNYDGDMQEYLNKTLTFMNSLSVENINSLASWFVQSMRNNFLIFGEHAFRKYAEGQKKRSVINVSLFDVLSVLMSRYPESLVQERKDLFRKHFFELMLDQEFQTSITLGTNQKNRVQVRFEKLTRIATEVFG